MPEEIPFSKTGTNQAATADPWGLVMNLACRLAVAIPVAHFTVSDLLNLEPGSIVETEHREGHNVPVLINAQAVGWAEFDFVAELLAVRLTELI